VSCACHTQHCSRAGWGNRKRPRSLRPSGAQVGCRRPQPHRGPAQNPAEHTPSPSAEARAAAEEGRASPVARHRLCSDLPRRRAADVAASISVRWCRHRIGWSSRSSAASRSGAESGAKIRVRTPGNACPLVFASAALAIGIPGLLTPTPSPTVFDLPSGVPPANDYLIGIRLIAHEFEAINSRWVGHHHHQRPPLRRSA